MRKSRIGFAFLALLFIGIVASAVRDLNSVKQFDAQYGAILTELLAQVDKTLAARETAGDLFALCEQKLEAVKTLPSTNNQVRLILRARLGSRLDDVTRYADEQPFEVRTDEFLSSLRSELQDLFSCLQQGIPESDQSF